MDKTTLQNHLGHYLYKLYGEFCWALINSGYDLDVYYNRQWGNFDRVLAKVSVLYGAQNYDDYKAFFEKHKQLNDSLVSPVSFSRITGIKARSATQTERTRRYRLSLRQERDSLRELTAKTWIENNLQEAKDFIKSLNLTGKS